MLSDGRMYIEMKLTHIYGSICAQIILTVVPKIAPYRLEDTRNGCVHVRHAPELRDGCGDKSV
jgi:hypothetical protein